MTQIGYAYPRQGPGKKIGVVLLWGGGMGGGADGRMHGPTRTPLLSPNLEGRGLARCCPRGQTQGRDAPWQGGPFLTLY